MKIGLVGLGKMGKILQKICAIMGMKLFALILRPLRVKKPWIEDLRFLIRLKRLFPIYRKEK